MKIGGPKGPKEILPKVPLDKPSNAQKPSFEQALKIDPKTPLEISDSSFVAKIAEKIKTGELSSSEAAKQLVENIVQQRSMYLSDDLQKRLQETLTTMLADDPLLAKKLSQLVKED